MNLEVGKSVRLNKEKLRLLHNIDFEDSTEEFTTGLLVKHSELPKRSWIVRMEFIDKEIEVSTTNIVAWNRDSVQEEESSSDQESMSSDSSDESSIESSEDDSSEYYSDSSDESSSSSSDADNSSDVLPHSKKIVGKKEQSSVSKSTVVASTDSKEDAILLNPHSFQWNIVAPGVSIADPRSSHLPISQQTKLLWNNIHISQFLGESKEYTETPAMRLETRSPLHYFLLAFPVNIVWNIVHRTNELKPWEKSGYNWIRFSVRKFFKIIGLMILMTLLELEDRRQYFQSPPKDFDPNKSHFGSTYPQWSNRFGIGETEFSFLLHNICWSKLEGDDPWRKVRDFINAFNERRTAVVNPSDALTVDESMSANKTKMTVANGFEDGLPHQTKIPRKPESTGCEFKTLIDARSNIMLKIELQEGKRRMAKKDFCSVTESSGTATLLRLTESYHNSHRTIYADSAFASVKSASLLKEHGLYFMGMVKTAHSQFPLKYLRSHLDDKSCRGKSIYLRSNDGNFNAVGWKDHKVMTLVSTCGDNRDTFPLERPRYANVNGERIPVKKSVNISAIPREYFSFAHKIDVHNHLRQGSLALEKTIKTNDWALRIISTTIGIIVVDGYNMYLLEKSENQQYDLLSFRRYVQEIGMALANNDFDNNEEKSRKRRHVENDMNDHESKRSNNSLERTMHLLMPLKSHPKIKKESGGGKKRKQQRCKICGNKSAFYCSDCSSDSTIIPVCAPWMTQHGVERDELCFVKHFRQC